MIRLGDFLGLAALAVLSATAVGVVLGLVLRQIVHNPQTFQRSERKKIAA